MRKTLIVLLAIVLGVIVAEVTAVGVGHLIEHPRVLRCTSTEANGNGSISEGMAKIIGQQCRAEMEREDARRRLETAHNVAIVWAATIFARLFEPITLVLAALFSAVFAWALLRLAGLPKAGCWATRRTPPATTAPRARKRIRLSPDQNGRRENSAARPSSAQTNDRRRLGHTLGSPFREDYSSELKRTRCVHPRKGGRAMQLERNFRDPTTKRRCVTSSYQEAAALRGYEP
jgi:hypothetical protein